MQDERQLRKKGSHWLLAVPREVRAWLGITHPVKVYWHWRRSGEATITLGADRVPGRPPVARLTRALADAQQEIAAIRQRDERRDRGQYAEGYAHGYIKAYNLLVTGDGPAREAGERARRYFNAFPDAASAPPRQPADADRDLSKPRRNARRRTAQREAREERISLDTYKASGAPGAGGPEPGPPASAPPSPDVSAGEAVTPGVQPPGDPRNTHEAEQVPRL